MTIALIAVLIGFVALVWSADQFVTGAAVTARFMGMSRLMIGLTVVAFGTSAPEIFVSLNAAMKGAGDMAVGNALGSNLANVGMVLAVTAIIVAIPIPRALMRRELPILLFITALTGVLLYDHHLGWLDGLLLLASLVIGGVISIRSQDAVVIGEELGLDASECETGVPDDDISQKHAWWLLIGGLVVLVASSRLLVWGAQEAAQLLGVSQLVIGLTLLAVGTSLPELAASVACAFKGHVEIALGNVVGSNIFNLAAVLAIPALIGGVQLEPAIFSRDYLFMAGITLCLVLAIAVDALRVKGEEGTQPKLGKIAAALFLLTYCAYYLQLFSDL